MIEFEKRKVVFNIKRINNTNLFHFYLKYFITDYNLLIDII